MSDTLLDNATPEMQRTLQELGTEGRRPIDEVMRKLEFGHRPA